MFYFIFITVGGAAVYVIVLHMFSYKSFDVSGLKFMSVIHFEFIFGYGVREVLILFF